ncbi:MAG: haloacid dehalogenase type II [Chloroflexaceae bacterium]|jgi:2-haloacid dehalogenase|nr:haloacid dehalogenase type II [Chloroflexaceae bacterium]
MVLRLAFDIYGTLVDPLALSLHVRPLLGERANAFAALWREKQLEYAFRRGLMVRYVNFDMCTQQALAFAAASFGLTLADETQAELLSRYRQLPAFGDVAAGLAALKNQGHMLVAFSNGVAASVRALLDHAQVLSLLDDVVSVDEIQRFKPDPAVYKHLVARTGGAAASTWLISSNGWDVIGAKAVGLQAAWLRRDPARPFDPWEFAPDMVVASLAELAERMEAHT